MIYYFTWSRINNITACLAPQEAMRFGNTLHCTLSRILNSKPYLGPAYLSKVDLTNSGPHGRCLLCCIFHPETAP